jgi:hypothetical protein
VTTTEWVVAGAIFLGIVAALGYNMRKDPKEQREFEEKMREKYKEFGDEDDY